MRTLRSTTGFIAAIGIALALNADRSAAQLPEATLTSAEPWHDTSTLEETIRGAYDRLVAYLAASGTKAELTVSDFRTLSAGELERTPYSQIVSLPGPPRLEILHIRSTDALFGTPTTAFRGELHVTEGEAALRWRSTVEDGTFGAAMRLATDEPQLAHTRAATTFMVRRTISGQTTVYRAAFLWLLSPASAQLEAYPVDPLTEGVDLALFEKNPPTVERPAEASQRTGCSPENIAYCDDGAPQCRVTTTSYSSPWTYTPDATNHRTGGHVQSFRSNFTCTCADNCMSRCVASAEEFCNDSQDISGINFFHKAVGARSAQNGTVQAGQGGGAECVGAAACVVRECLTELFCSLNVSVTAVGSGSNGGAEVSFSPTNSVVWETHTGEGYTCAPCETMTPQPPPPPPPGGGGGGSVGEYPAGPPTSGGSSWWYVDCRSDGSIDFIYLAFDEQDAQEIGDAYCG